MPETSASIFKIEGLEQLRSANQRAYLEFLRLKSLSAGLYVLQQGATDTQRPHHQDELYYVIRGRARFKAGAEDWEVSAGSVLFVAAEVEHRFYDIVEEIALLVFFAPAET